MGVTATTELWRMSATELAEAIRSKQASSQEVVEAQLRRIEAVNPTVKAITIVLADEALEAAKAADRAVAAGRELPRLHGVPFTVKENIDLVGTPSTMGFKVLAESYPKLDAPAVERLRRSGAIPIGRTNMPSLGMRLHTDSELWGPTLNPWDASRTPGGSSGGEAAAVATGMSPLGLGNDTGGSLRWPAQCCGVCTLKATLGRIARASSIEPADPPIGTQLMGVDGPVARRVADIRAAFDVLSGPTWRDPWSVPAPLYGPKPARPVRVAIVVDPAGLGIAKQVQDGIRKAARALDSAGYEVEEIEPPSIAAAAKAAVDMLNPEWRLFWQFVSSAAEADTKQVMTALLESVGEPEPLTATLSFMSREALLRGWGEFQESRPLIVAPISTDIPFELGKDLTAAGVTEIHRAMRMAHAINLLGLPAVAVPVGFADGLPQVVQVIGPRYREDMCLDAASVIEERLGSITPIDPR
jgi:amidase